jgi:hypothetical protein
MTTVMKSITEHTMADTAMKGPFNWVVGDTASYKLNLASFINGTMVMTIKDVQATTVTIQQDLDIQIQKQSCTEVIDSTNGQVKSMVCNGQAQNPGDAGDVTVIDSKEDTVTVPAGTFDCLYIKAHSKSQNADIEQWANPKLVPVMGMVKALMPSQIGQIDIQLTSFKKN